MTATREGLSVAVVDMVPARVGLWSQVWQRLKRNRLAVAALALLSLFYLLMLLSLYEVNGHALIWQHGPNDIPDDVGGFLLPPSLEHPLGTDEVGRDQVARILAGARISLTLGLVATAFALGIGVVIGSAAGFYRGWVDGILMRFTDAMLAFPTLPLMLVLAVIWSANFWSLSLIIGLFSWMGMARLVRGEFLVLREREFAVAARAIGASNRRIIFKHLLRNAWAPVIVAGTFGCADAIMTEAWLSFLGFGIQPPTATWGNMLSGSEGLMQIAPWLVWFPGLFIFLTVLAFNFLGDALRDALDPHLKRS